MSTPDRAPTVIVHKPTFAQLPLAAITPSRSNPRKHFDAAKLAELAEDIKRRGIDTPITVRPLPGDRLADTERDVQYELVCGERRYRASLQAGLATIPSMIRALTDEQALEVQLVENLQRDDLTELEEAEGYEALMQHSSLNADQVAERINKSRSYVYGRLKLLDLCAEARTSLRDRTIDASRALLVARIPDHKLQIKAMKEIVAGNRYMSPADRQPMTHREAASHVQSNYMLKLSDARFQITAVDLVPDAGSCKTCTKRTGHNPDLFTDVKGADVCTDPPCFHRKEQAHSASQVAAAKAKGQTVIAGKEAQELRASNSYTEKFVGYRRLDAVDDSPTDQPLRKLIGAAMKAEGIKPVLIESTRGKCELVECITNEVALKLLKAVESKATAAPDAASGAPKVSKEVQKLVDDKKAKAEAKAKAQFEREWRSTLVEDTWVTLRDDADIAAFTTNVHRYLVVRAARSLSTDNAAAIAKLLGLGKVAPSSALVDHAKATDNPALLHLLIIMQEASDPDTHTYGGRVPNEGLMLVAGNAFGEQLDGVIEEIKGEIKAKIWPKIAPKKAPKPPAADAAKGDLPHSPAARPNVGAGVGKKPKGGKPAKVATAAPKTSPEEAMQGIAAALQGIEGQASAPSGAVAPAAEPDGSGHALTTGTRVRITINLDRLGTIARKWAGREGTITKTNVDHDPDFFDVTFKGSTGGIATFRTDQLEPCEVAA